MVGTLQITLGEIRKGAVNEMCANIPFLKQKDQVKAIGWRNSIKLSNLVSIFFSVNPEFLAEFKRNLLNVKSKQMNLSHTFLCKYHYCFSHLLHISLRTHIAEIYSTAMR